MELQSFIPVAVVATLLFKKGFGVNYHTNSGWREKLIAHF
jgi:hypothetical protein